MSNHIDKITHWSDLWGFDTLCGLELISPLKNIDVYNDKEVIDGNGVICVNYGKIGVYGFKDYKKPTCAECSRILQRSLHHCSVHGFLDGRDVTFNSKCDYCGESV